MKKSYVLLKVICVSITIFFCSSQTLAFEFEVVDRVGDVGEYSSLALDKDGFPHISYYSENDPGSLKYARWIGNTWTIETIDRGSVGKYNKISLDSNGYPHIVYWYESGRDLKYAHFNGNSWSIETIESYYEVIQNYSFDIKVDSRNLPHISYTFKNSNNTRWICHTFWNGVRWNRDQITSSTNDEFGEFVSLVLDKFDSPHIAFYTATDRQGLLYAHIVNSAWKVDLIDDSGVAGKHTSIALDSHGYPHISYWRDYGWIFKYAFYDGVKWNIQTLGNGTLSSIQIDSNDNPHICYREPVGWDNTLNYTYKDNTGWHTMRLLSNNAQGTPSLALDYYNNAHIAFQYTNSQNDLYFAKPNSFGPSNFSLYAPANGSFGNPQTEFRWYPSGYQGKGLSKYQLWVDNSLLIDNIPPSRTFTKIATTLSDGWHTWKVKAIALAGSDIWSTETWSIRIDATPPASFNLLSPKNDFWTKNRVPILQWEASTDAGSGLQKYQLFIDEAMSKDNIPITQTSSTPAANLSDGKHTWFIKAIDQASYAIKSNQTWTINIDTTPPGYFSLLSPNSGAWVGNRKIQFLWNTATDAGVGLSKYQLLIDNKVVVDSIHSKVTNYDFTQSPTLADGRHSWNIRAIDYLGIFADSSPFEINIDKTPPSAPSLTTPAKDGYVIFPTPDFSWNESKDTGSGINYYQLWIDGVLSVDNLHITKTAPSSPLSEGRHSWYVKVLDMVGNEIKSEERACFGEWNPPNSFDLVSPPDGSILQEELPCFVWHKSFDYGSGLGKYQLYINGKLNRDNISPTDTSAMPLQPLASGEYIWSIKALDKAGNSTSASSIYKIKLLSVNHAPSAFALLYPPNNMETAALNFTFTWQASIDPDQGDSLYYELSVCEDTSFTNNRILFKSANSEYHIGSGLQKGKIYYWKVAAIDRNGVVKECNTMFSFRTSNVATIVNLSNAGEIPNSFVLYQNYPNPFNPYTNISFDIPMQAPIEIHIFDLHGRLVKTLFSGKLQAGRFELKWDGRDSGGNILPSGIYLCKMLANDFVGFTKMSFIK